MKHLKTMLCLLLSSLLLGGCAGYKVDNPWCTVAGTIIGGGIGYGINEGAADDGDEDDTRAGAVAGGAALGAAIGTIFCAEKKVEPVVPPTPAPAPTCLSDADGDGIKGDGEPGCPDRCPATPAGVAVDVDGCPKVGETLMQLEGVNFAFNSAKLTPDSETVLNKAVDALRNAGTVSVRVEGHTDSIGSNAYNQRLSEKRAAAVVSYLESQGIAGTRLEPVGMGEENPVASNDTEEGRYQNRRVVFVVTGK